jgi:hypothetical protein
MSRSIRRILVALTGALLLLTSISSAALADQRDFNLNNISDHILAQAFVSAVSDPEWGDDILREHVMNPGDVWSVWFDRGAADTCVWDVKVVTMAGIEVTVPEIDFCVVTDVNITN